MIRKILGAFKRAHYNLRQTEHTYMVLIALAVGLLGGLCAVGFRELIELGQFLAWRDGDYSLDYIRSLPWIWKLAVPTCGGLIVGLIVHYFAREAKGHGVPEVMEAVALHAGRIRPRVVIAKMVASGVCIASGGSVGREGPIVQIGSSIGSSVGQWLRLSEPRLRTLVGCGAAAGIAGTFNAPVAGALFAVEIILGDFRVSRFSPIVISSVAATVVSRHFLGDVLAFEVPAYSLVNANELFAYALLGILAGLAALAFIKVLYFSEDLFDRVRIYPPLKTALGGTVIGLIALKFPQVFGVGYEAIGQALRGEMIWSLLLVLIGIKIVAVSITIGSGGSGGIFAPSLFIGAMLGGAVGTVVNLIWPESAASPGAYALVGMGAVVAAGTHAPITAILIIFELTADYKIMLPLMISCIIATLLSTQLQKSSIYTLKLIRRGVNIFQGQSVNVLTNLKVNTVMREEFIAVRPAEPLMPIVSLFVDHPGCSVFVSTNEDRLLGIITIDEIRPLIANASALQGVVVAQDLMLQRDFPTFHPKDSLDDVMRQLSQCHYEAPVVEDGKIVGGVRPEDVIQRYNAEIFKRDMAASMAKTIVREPGSVDIPGVQDMNLAESPVPPRYVGQSLAGLDLRNKFNITVLLVKHKEGNQEEMRSQLPNGGTVLRENDSLLLLGAPDDIAKFEREG